MVIPNMIPDFLVEDPNRIAWLVGGYLMAQVWEALKARVKDWREPGTHHRFQRVSALGTILVVMFSINIWIAAKTTQNYEYSKNLADISRSCWVNFADNINTRSAITSDNDRLTIVSLTSINALLGDIARPTPAGVTAEEQLRILQLRASQSYGVTNQVLQRLETNQRERAQHPVKDPLCGKGR